MTLPYEAGPPLSCDQIRDADRWAIEELGIPGMALMENAGAGAAEIIHQDLSSPAAAEVVILCGPGNNGGDGYVVARHLLNAGVPVLTAVVIAPKNDQSDAAVNLRILERMDAPLLYVEEGDGLAALRERVGRADAIVDALLGTGSAGAPRGNIATLIEDANAASGARRFAIDIPTGLDGDTGEAREPCFRAHCTITMFAVKQGFTAQGARPYVGRVVVVSIGAPRRLG